MDRIEDCFTFLLGKAYQRFSQIEKERLRPYGVTPVQFGLLHLLWEKDGRKGSELGERLRLDGATITGMLDRLEQSGLVERRSDPKDRRINLIYLTPKGKELEKPLNDLLDQLQAELLSDFPEEEVTFLKKMLVQLGLGR